MITNKKYEIIITEEDERYGEKGYTCLYWANNPWDGLLNDICCGDNVEELLPPEGEGLFYQLFHVKTGKRVGCGWIDIDCLKKEIAEFERENEV